MQCQKFFKTFWHLVKTLNDDVAIFVYCCLNLQTLLTVKIGNPFSKRDKKIPRFLNCYLLLFAFLFFAVLVTYFLLPVLLPRNKIRRTTFIYAEVSNLLSLQKICYLNLIKLSLASFLPLYGSMFTFVERAFLFLYI